MSANREYKNSLFTTLFADADELLSLYGALSENPLPSDTIVEIATLDAVLFTKRRNDIAFVVGGKIVVLLEHQSTISDNIPLRLLVYAARTYEKLVDKKSVYKKNLVKIPKPEFIVLYNGIEPFPDEKILRLSDAYYEMPGRSAVRGGLLELEVRVLNINRGRNEHIVKQCETLDGYVEFVHKVRENEKSGMDLLAAITNAVKGCIDEGILKEFLERHSSEVINMLTMEWDDDLEKSVIREEGREEGIEEGIVKGIEKGIEKGVDKGVDISAEIISLLVKRVPIEEIAACFKVSEDKVKTLQIALSQIPA